MGPDGPINGPDDLGKAIVDFIKGAQKSLDIAVQELDSWKIADAILSVKAKGVRVRIALESDYLKAKKRRPEPKLPGGSHEPNRAIQDALLRSAIWVRSDFNPKIFHQKFVIRDRKSVLTGSTNFTDTGISKNLNHVVIVHDEAVAKAYQREFDEIRKGQFGIVSIKQGDAPTTHQVAGVPIRIAFAPDHSPEMEIMKQMLKAKRRVDFAIFTFSTSSGIDDTMIKLSQLNLPVRGIIDARVANQKWAASRPVRNAGAEMYKIKRGSRVGKLHHKLMVIDKQVLVVGSFNYTGPANKVNDENIMIIGKLDDQQSQASINAQKSLAKYAFDEIDRIIHEDGDAM